MRIFAILVASAFAAHFTPVEAHNQPRLSSTLEVGKKIYVSPENLHFGNEGIFWQVSQDNWIPVSGVNYDSEGIYLARSGISWSYYVCTSCGRTYAEKPSQCENPDCDSTSFDLVYEDVWDR